MRRVSRSAVVLALSLVVLAPAQGRAETSTTLTWADGIDCEEPTPLTTCTTAASSAEGVSVLARATSPAEGAAPGRGRARAWSTLEVRVAHDGARSLSVSFTLAVDEARVTPSERRAVEGGAVVLATISFVQSGVCCGTFHQRPIVRSAHLGGTWWAPESVENYELRLGGGLGGPDPLPPGEAVLSLRLEAFADLRGPFNLPVTGDIAAQMRARVVDVNVIERD